MDELFCELFGVDSDTAFNFFLSGLREVTGRKPNDEMFYVASILAHYTQTSRHDTWSMPALANLSEVCDQFLLLETDDPEILEIGGSQILLFAGFFRDRMCHRHNVRWYDELGQSFYDRASDRTPETKRQKLFEGMAASFPNWTLICRDLSRSCYENRYLLKSTK